jgi:cation:H+ antiporter
LTILLLLAAFGAILGGAFLFTNAVEWLGHRLHIGTGAVGSVIAAVATALPESVIPVVAIIGGRDQADEVAIGAIIGAPFMLATVAMALVGVSALLFHARRDQGRTLTAHRPTLKRDLTFFLVLLGAALAVGIGAPDAARIAVAAGLVLAYATYIALSLRRGGAVQAEEELPTLTFDPTPRDPPAMPAVVLQFLLGLGAIVGGAHLFVHEILALADDLGVAPLVLSLVLAPLATELPEKANSVLWIRDGKDSLALGNITGALVFQSTLPAAVGIAFTRWELDRLAVLAAAAALAGGLVALWALHLQRRFTAPAILAWAALFATGATVVIVGGS